MSKLLLIGTTIKTNKEHYDHLDALTERNNDAHIAFKEASHLIKETNKALWDFLNNAYPDLVLHECTYKHDTHEILITGYNKKFD